MVGGEVGSPSVPAADGIAAGVNTLGSPPFFFQRAVHAIGGDTAVEEDALDAGLAGGGLGGGVVLLCCPPVTRGPGPDPAFEPGPDMMF